MAESNPDTAKDVTGGCLCGKVRYRARTDSDEAYYCHCRMCQLAFGNTRVAWFNLPQAALTWEGEPTFYASSKFARRGFCGTCGTPLTYAHDGLPNEIDITTCSLDDPEAHPPRDQVWTTHELRWMPGIAKLSRFPRSRSAGQNP